MTANPSLYRRLRLTLLILLLTLLGPAAGAVEVWDGFTASSSLTPVDPTLAAGTAGSAENPYAIASGADLKYLQGHSSYWNKCFRQTADIDLGYNDLGGLIGYGTTGSSSATNAFKGSYDGAGHELRHVKVEWGSLNTMRVATGLFGLVYGGSITNLILVKPKAVREADPIVNIADVDLKLGILAGAVGANGTRIENITVVGGLITDSGHDPEARSLFVGVIAGDLTAIFESTANINESQGTLTIANIAVDCDIDLGSSLRPASTPDASNSGRYTQFNVGGIIGRARRPRFEVLPSNTFFTGKIKAPAATVSPLVGFSRGNGDGTKKHYYLARGYAGEVLNSPTMTSTGSDQYYILNGSAITAVNGTSATASSGYADTDPNAGHYYGDYQVYDYSTEVDGYVAFTATSPDTEGAWGIRTLETNTHTANSATDLFGPITPEDWRCVQGVNHGIYADVVADDDARQAVLQTFNDYTAARSDLLRWGYSHIYGMPVPADLTRIGVSRTGILTFEAFVGGVTPAVVHYRWEARLPSGTYVEKGITDVPQYSFASTDLPDLYTALRVTLCDADDNPVCNGSDPVQAEVEIEPIWATGSLVIDKVMLDAESFKYIASVYDSDSSLFVGGAEDLRVAGLTWVWEVSSDPTNCNSWEATDVTGGQNWIQPYRTDRFYRVSLVLEADGTVIMQQIRGPQKMIFVYDKAMTDMGRELGVTDFDGIDHSLSTDAETVYYPDGDNRNTGYDPHHAVRSMERAYELADDGAPYTDNVIVIMGFNGEYGFLHYNNRARYAKNVTLTGNPSGLLSGGALNLTIYGENDSYRAIGGQTKIEKLTLVGYTQMPWRNDEGVVQTPTSSQLFLYCELHDLTIGEGVNIRKYAGLASGNGQLDSTRAPAITITAGFHNYNLPGPPPYPEGNAEPGIVTLSVNSGCWGRILGGSRNTSDGYQPLSHNIYGSPTEPHRVTLNISISHPQNKGTLEYSDVAYSYDIGLVSGGQTDGSIYGDTQIFINSGTMGRIMTGNISYGRVTGDGYPTDSFFGSCEVTLLNGVVEELYGGTLGRVTTGTASTSPSCNAYFYGRSIINIDGGTIRSNIYGAGAGGVTGIGKCDHEEHHGHHTSDPAIPYYATADATEVSYGPFYVARAGVIPKMTLRDGTTIDLDDSYCRVNINAGVINGDVYGGGSGYSNQVTDYKRALPQAGDLFGHTVVTMQSLYSVPPVVKGNIYGGSAGTSRYYELMKAGLIAEGIDADEADAQAASYFGDLARVFGSTSVELYGGTVEGNVYGGSRGVGQFSDMASVFGSSRVLVDGATVNGNIFGGCAFANLRKSDVDPAKKGDTYVEVRSGVVGNNIFGGSEGSDDYTSYIEGDTDVKILGGSYIADWQPYSYRDPVKGTYSDIERTFNTYGGCYHNGTINGSTSVYIEKSLLNDAATVAPVETGSPGTPDENYADAIADEGYRHFCVYGAGYGEKTLVRGGTDVHINIVGDQFGGVLMPTPDFPSSFVPGQTFFDVAGGGYNGEVGQWMARRTGAGGEEELVPVASIASPEPTDYEVYEGGDAYVTVEGSAFIRKVVGGGFYASVNNAETWLKSGTIQSAYGGGLLGYVHNNARMAIGTHAARAGEPLSQRFTDEAEKAATDNSRLFIVGDVYGGNDVKGVVGTVLWTQDGTGTLAAVDADQGPLFAADVSPDSHKGVMLNIFGGNIGGNVYGAGNGHYRGYYVPEWTRYNRGADRHYRLMRTNRVELDEHGNPTNERTDALGNTYYVGRAYRSRPMTGTVKLDIAGNGENDRVTIRGSVFGGGRSCTIGQWNTLLPFEDPRSLTRGGYLHMNIGSHVAILSDLYLGSEGAGFNTYNTVPAAVASQLTPGNAYGEDFDERQSLGDIAYDHWWWNTLNSRYEPGFPPPGQLEGNYGFTGDHIFRAYIKNIEMNGDVELTFYDDLFLRNADGSVNYDAAGNPLRKSWVPGEQALLDYDSRDVFINSFYLGGRCGSMTNNRVMRYDYGQGKPVEPDDSSASASTEEWGSIYRVTIPAGVTLNGRIVAGSDNATVVDYPFNADFTEVVPTTPEGLDNARYRFVGGLVTQCNYSYDLIVYCDRHRSFNLDVDPAVYLAESVPDTYTLTYGPDAGTVIHRYEIPITDLLGNPDMFTDDYGRRRYSLAVLKDAGGNITGGYIGTRESRDTQGEHEFGKTAVKMTLANDFVLNSDDDSLPADDPETLRHLYGGLVYGGCYNTGNTMGHVILNVGCNLLGPRISSQTDANFGELSSLRYNIGRVFGGGFGQNTCVDGNTYINLLHNFKGMNVFGGGCRGDVTGSTNIVYLGSEESSYVYGAIYGGGLMGNVGTADETALATSLNLYSGNVDKVYGGSCMGDVYGGTSVDLRDEVTNEIPHLDYARLLANMGWDAWGGSRLIAGSVYGGNDISGSIIVPASVPAEDAFETTVRMYEVKGSPSGDDGGSGDGPGKTSPGADNGYNGFPLVGDLYGGSNGNYGVSANHSGNYLGGSLWFATGEATAVSEVRLNGLDGVYDPFDVPHVGRSRIILNGGTVINAYGGGNQATITDRACVTVDYDKGNAAAGDPGNRKARAGFASLDELRRVWHTLHLTSEEQLAEVGTLDPETGAYVFDYQIFRLFGGNENADMAIQPEWDLQCGYLGSIYSGGNFGRMTYFNPTPGPGENHGLTLHVNSRDLHAVAVYGGGRVGDIDPAIPASMLEGPKRASSVPEDFYGATLNIIDGVIDHVYGGNDVSGVVHYGTNVNIHGAISGDVYCAGNGNYRYFYDPTLPAGSKIEEMYDDAYGGRYFRLPLKEGFGGTDPKGALKILAINSYRPNVDKAWLNISGTAESVAYVRGNVYCGGNSATITGETLGEGNGDIRFTIGDHVTLNGVFMGSNGYSLTDGSMIYVTEQLNNIDFTKANELTLAEAEATPEDHDASDLSLYPNLLDLYMRAVDVNGLPSDFDFPDTLTDAYIGDFYLGGNRGSMLTSKSINLTFPSTLVIFGKIVGGSDNANLNYKGVVHTGGLTRPLADPSNPHKVHLTVKSRFEPWTLEYPLDDDIRKITRHVVPETDSRSGLLCFADRVCNIYGGCFSSGRTVGDIRIDLFSDLSGEYAPGSDIANSLAEKGIAPDTPGHISKRMAIANGISTDNLVTRRSFAVIGGGYGAGSEVRGDITVCMQPVAGDAHPSAAAIFGGMQEGTLVGNTRVEIRDGQVLTNVYGGSEAAPMYGSTHVIVGYPEYYVCDIAGTYPLQRADHLSKAALEGWTNDVVGPDNEEYTTPVVRSSISLRKGDLVSRRVYDIIGSAGKASCFTLVADETPATFGAGLTWDDIDISVGDPASKTDPDAEYFAHGNIYGGGFVSASSASTLAGLNTVCSFRATGGRCLDPADVGRGGNSTILIWDNKDNALAEGPAAAALRDHIDVGTCGYRPKTVVEGQDIGGLWKYIPAIHRFEHMPSRPATQAEAESGAFYTVRSDGGIYGGGRKVFVENFRDVDIAYYGYALGSPQYPKLINTAQHIDLLTFADCCVQLQGANDFAVNSVDAANYSLTRVAELQMLSSLALDGALDPGDVALSGGHNTRHETARSRNFVAFYHDVHYVGAVTSNTPFDAPHHDRLGALSGAADTYLSVKKRLIQDYYSIVNSASATNEEKLAAAQAFNTRNSGTAPNMIGINNGYVLTVQGSKMEKNGDVYIDERYYGPITGVFEVKLLSLAEGEGGGYIFGLNHHDNPDSFLESTGNFVFPGAAYTADDASSSNYNYIRDDCFPVGQGWESYWKWNTGCTYADDAAVDPVATNEHGNCNALQDCHYWYVAGSKYFYNVTLTAYTSSLDETFNVDNSSGIVYLYGVEPGARFTVKEIAWEESPNTVPDLTFTDSADPAADLPYRFYLTVDQHPEHLRTPKPAGSTPDPADNWYVTAIPRADYVQGSGTADPNADAFPTQPDAAVNNTYGDDNVPQVGIFLVDKHHGNVGRSYYTDHLSADEKVRIVLTTGEGVDELTYTINLTVRYLLGPTITGLPAIENCALPGEYIYANSFGVDVDLDDDNMSVSSRNWYIAAPSECTPDANGNLVLDPATASEVVKQLKGQISGTHHVAEVLNDMKFDNDRQIHIPAYRYRDGWRLIYEVVVNGRSFLVLPDGQLADKPDKKPYEDRLVVHNYHRMRPYDGTSILTDADGYPVDAEGNPVSEGNYVERYEDLRLIAGARIYIEDDADMAYFYTWLRQLQNAPSRTTPSGRTIDPQYGEGLHVYLMNNVTMPDGVAVNDLVWRGTFHGGGHSVIMAGNKAFLGDNQGTFYNTGFVSDSNDADLAVFRANGTAAHKGLIENCFFYNTRNIGRGTLVRGSSSGVGDVVNCFETDYEDDDTGDGLRMASYDEFNGGEIAFNLNRFYLKKRYNLATDTPDGELLAPLMEIYNDGEYRYGRWSSDGNALALRTADTPNYHDYRGIRIDTRAEDLGAADGRAASFHNTDDLPDLTRYSEEPDGTVIYLPNFPDDFLYFGQDLSQTASPAAASTDMPGVPCAVTEDLRVYRASGYHGTTEDVGYHFNSAAVANRSGLTAIDFGGYRDRQLGMTYFVEEEAESLPAYAAGQPKVYYPPMLDLPEELKSFAVAEGITHNLLVYVPDDDPSDPLKPLMRDALEPFVYTRDTREADVSAHVLTTHLPDNTATTPVFEHRPTVRLLHLVDKHDFHCPIAFEVTDTVWYQREPAAFATTAGDAWEGLCLPFDARTVWGTMAERDGLLANPMRDHGELSHFYGPDAAKGYYRLVGSTLTPVEGYENEAPSHEYWLRKFTGEGEVGTETHLFFGRPDGDDDTSANAGTQYLLGQTRRANYLYANPHFSVVYGSDYNEGQTHARPCYSEDGVVYDRYPVITAGHPYLVAFPGRKFYEFDMSGEFYADRFPGTPAVPQLVTFANVGAATGAARVMIPVTGPSALLSVEHDSHRFTGTFARFSTAASAAYAVVDTPSGGSLFTASAGAEVLPFRTYIQRPAASSAPMRISSRDADIVGDVVAPGDDEPDDEGADDDEQLMEVTVEFNELVIRSPWAVSLTVYDLAGRAVRQIEVAEGENRYSCFAPGLYIVLDTKFRIN